MLDFKAKSLVQGSKGEKVGREEKARGTKSLGHFRAQRWEMKRHPQGYGGMRGRRDM